MKYVAAKTGTWLSSPPTGPPSSWSILMSWAMAMAMYSTATLPACPPPTLSNQLTQTWLNLKKKAVDESL